MAEKDFILQGFTDRTHGDAIRELFDLAEIERVLVSVAFVTESGVQQIEEQLTPYGKSLVIFAGIRNEITSHQGLLLLNSFSSELYAVDTGARNIVFHPKIFFVRGKNHARMVIGSANLTLGGLNNNIEAGVVLEFDLSNANDKKLVDGIEAEFAKLPGEYPEHILKVSGKPLLDEWLGDGRLVDEMAVPPPRPSTSTGGGTGGTDTVPRIKLKVPALYRALKKAKAVAKAAPGNSAPIKAGKAKAAAAPAAPGVVLELVWESKPLTRRDLTIPTEAGTHATGSVNLDKGLLSAEVDHRHYFRNDVFPGLTWTPTNKSGAVEEAYAKFQLVVKGISHGEFDLRLAHTTSTTSASYKQNNAMTRLGWGAAREHIARSDLIGRTLSLYRDNADEKRFVLEID